MERDAEAEAILTGRKPQDGEEWHERNALLGAMGKPLTEEELAAVGKQRPSLPNPAPYIRLADSKNREPDGIFKMLPKNTAVEVGLKWTF